jgi:hypothetical protein
MASSLTRGPLPAKVYWRRRLMLLGAALALVLAFGRMLGGGSDGSSDDPGGAQQVAGQPSSSAPSAKPKATRKSRPNIPIVPPTSRAPELAVPDGPCEDDDVSVTPSLVGDAVGGRDITFQLDVRTILDEACTWRVSANHLTVAITSGDDDIWSTQQCPATIPVQDLVVRRAVTASLTLVWDAKRSDEDCSRLTDWAMPGYYHVAAAALGGEPVDVQFEIVKPEPEVIVETVTPDPQGNQGGQGGQGGQGKPGGGKPNQPDDDASPSGAVEPSAG